MVVTLLEDGDNIKLLMNLDFTETQAKLYLTLVNTGKIDVKTLAKLSNVPRQATYRALGELQEKGLVEKIIALPQLYKAIPLQDGLALMIKEKSAAHARMTKNVTEFLQRYQTVQEKQPREEKYQISILEGKDTIINKIKTLTETSQETICVCQTLQRWLHVNNELAEIIVEALKRGVKYQVVLEKADGEIIVPKEFKQMLTNKNYDVQVVRDQLKINAAIYDGKIGCFSFYPAKALSETPIIVTNHPSLVIGFQDHFSKLWGNSKKTEIKYKTN